MSNNNQALLLLVAGLAIAGLAAGPTLFQSDSPQKEPAPSLAETEAAEKYRELRVALEEQRAKDAKQLARLTENDEANNIETDGKFSASFNYATEGFDNQGKLTAVFIYGSGNCQLLIESDQPDSTYQGRSIGCAGTINEKTGAYELSGHVITENGRRKPFSAIGATQADGTLDGVLTLNGTTIDLQP